MSNPTEPSAAMRQVAHSMREFYVALLSEGFTEEQAMDMVRFLMEQYLPKAPDHGG